LTGLDFPPGADRASREMRSDGESRGSVETLVDKLVLDSEKSARKKFKGKKVPRHNPITIM
jgi:hypothetical protein